MAVAMIGSNVPATSALSVGSRDRRLSARRAAARKIIPAMIIKPGKLVTFVSAPTLPTAIIARTRGNEGFSDLATVANKASHKRSKKTAQDSISTVLLQYR